VYLRYEKDLLELLEQKHVFPPRYEIICTPMDKAASLTMTLTVVLKNSVNGQEQEVTEFYLVKGIEGIIYSI